MDETKLTFYFLNAETSKPIKDAKVRIGDNDIFQTDYKGRVFYEAGDDGINKVMNNEPE